MKTCYAALDKVLKPYSCTFKDVVVENLYTTSMDELHENVAYRNEIYKERYPTGT